MAVDPHPARMLLVKGLGGLGNRMLGLLSAMLYGKLSGRQLVVDWTDPPYSSDGENVFPLLFASPSSMLTPGELRGRAIAPEAWDGWVETTVEQQMGRFGWRFTKSELRQLTADPAKLAYPEEVVVYWSRVEQVHEMRRHFRGKFRHLAGESDDKILRDLLHTEVVLDPEIVAQVERFRGLHFDGEVVGVHVRNSDLTLGVEKLLRLADEILARLRGSKVFLATDNADTLDQARRRYGEERVLATEKWFPAPGRAIHLAADRELRLRAAREALVDLYLLGECDWLLADWRSSFAYLAWLLFRGPRSRVRNTDPGRYLPRHIGHRLGSWKLKLWNAVHGRRRIGNRT